MDAQDVIDDVRKKLKDDIKPYRLSDANFFPLIDAALFQTEKRRPDYMIQSDGTLTEATAITAATDTVPFPDRFREALACHVAYQEYISEDADRHNTSQANSMLNRYEMLIQSI